MKRIVLGILIALSVSPIAIAAGGDEGWVLSPAFMYLYDTTSTGGQTTTTTRLLLDARLGYKLTSNPIYLGAIYGIDNRTTSTSGSSTTNNTSSYGPTVGIMTENVFMLFSYFFSSQNQQTSGGSTTTYSGGSGFQVNFGYRFHVTPQLSLAPELAYRSLSYTTVSPGSSTDYKTTTLVPYVGFWYFL